MNVRLDQCVMLEKVWHMLLNHLVHAVLLNIYQLKKNARKQLNYSSIRIQLAQKILIVILADATSIMGILFISMKLHPLQSVVAMEISVSVEANHAKAVIQDITLPVG